MILAADLAYRSYAHNSGDCYILFIIISLLIQAFRDPPINSSSGDSVLFIIIRYWCVVYVFLYCTHVFLLFSRDLSL